ncbi:transposase [Paraburkholderia caribensis]|uniref:transposase n=1 Tax=Paraburkholderia caribensis TaxID=75105 RepID=UPI00390898A9
MVYEQQQRYPARKTQRPLMHVHFVFVTRYRRDVFTKEILGDPHHIFSTTCADFEALPVAVAVRQSKSSANTSNSGKRRTDHPKAACVVRAILPRH